MMFTLPRLLAIGLILAAAGAITILRVQNQALEAERHTALVERDAARTQVKANLAVIESMAKHDMQSQQAQAQLRMHMSEVRGRLGTHEQTIRNLELANETLRRWSNTPLPEPVISMRRRPAITGSQAYRDWLSRRESVQLAPYPTGDEWRPAP